LERNNGCRKKEPNNALRGTMLEKQLKALKWHYHHENNLSMVRTIIMQQK
jgi:hypothetical protein